MNTNFRFSLFPLIVAGTSLTIALVTSHLVSVAAPVGPKLIVTPPTIQANGNEPFWGVSVNAKSIAYRSPEGRTIQFPLVKPLKAEGRPEDQTIVYPLRKGTLKGNLVLVKMPPSSFCNDTMSDTEYPYSATLILNNQVFSGCASTLKSGHSTR
jgi:uncharacterized membrane protein